MQITDTPCACSKQSKPTQWLSDMSLQGCADQFFCLTSDSAWLVGLQRRRRGVRCTSSRGAGLSAVDDVYEWVGRCSALCEPAVDSGDTVYLGYAGQVLPCLYVCVCMSVCTTPVFSWCAWHSVETISTPACNTQDTSIFYSKSRYKRMPFWFLRFPTCGNFWAAQVLTCGWPWTRTTQESPCFTITWSGTSTR